MTIRTLLAQFAGLFRRLGSRLWLARYPLLGALTMAAGCLSWIFVSHGREEIKTGKTLVTRLEAWSYDLPFWLRTRGPLQERILLVEITTNSFTRATDRDDDRVIDRRTVADLLARVGSLHPRLILLDLWFSKWGDSDDPLLTEQLQKLVEARVPVVVATTTLAPRPNEPVSASDPKVNQFINPAFLIPGVQLGVADVDNRPGNTVRLLPGVFLKNAPPSLAWAAAAALSAPVTKKDRPDAGRWLNYYGPSPQVFERLELRELLQRDPGDLDRFRSRIVVVGFAPPREQFVTPIGGGTIGGAEVHATALLNLLSHDWLDRMPVAWQSGGILIHAIWLGLTLGRHRNPYGWFLALASATTLIGLSIASHLLWGLWCWWVIVALQTVAAILASLLPRGYAAFISYRTSDGAEAALALEQGLLARGLRAYLAPGSIDIGEPFAEEMLRRLRRAPYFLLVLSNDARRELQANRGWVATEVTAALNARKTVVIVRPFRHPPKSKVTSRRLASQPVPNLKAEELDAAFRPLSKLQCVALDIGEHRKAALDNISRRLW